MSRDPDRGLWILASASGVWKISIKLLDCLETGARPIFPSTWIFLFLDVGIPSFGTGTERGGFVAFRNVDLCSAGPPPGLPTSGRIGTGVSWNDLISMNSRKSRGLYWGWGSVAGRDFEAGNLFVVRHFRDGEEEEGTGNCGVEVFLFSFVVEASLEMVGNI